MFVPEKYVLPRCKIDRTRVISIAKQKFRWILANAGESVPFKVVTPSEAAAVRKWHSQWCNENVTIVCKEKRRWFPIEANEIFSCFHYCCNTVQCETGAENVETIILQTDEDIIRVVTM